MFFNICEKYEERIAASKKRMDDTWKGLNNDRPYFQISDVNYFLAGNDDIPENYFEKEVKFENQKKKIENHLENINDDFVPVFFPWYGTGVVQSALGCKIIFDKRLDPVCEGGFIKTKKDIESLKMPDPYKDGLMPKVLECIDYFVSHTDAHVSVTDCQSPFNIALTLVGLEDLIYLMYDDGDSVHTLMRFCTDVLIMWIKTQKKHLKHRLKADAFPHALYLPEFVGGVAMADDDLVVLSKDLYKEFILPYIDEVFEEFGGGTLHFCGSAHHQIDTFKSFKHCKGVNNFCMNDFWQVSKLKENFSPSCIMLCDFNDINIEEYAEKVKELAKKPNGYIISIFVAPEMQLSKGAYSSEYKKSDAIISECKKHFADWLN